jgi:diguanylate cyclase (GGDEF)-like protein
VLLVVDLDGFKPVNDGFGHASGDAVLVAVARRLRFCVREVDLVARIGGDEFALLVRGEGDVPPIDADLVARRVVDAVAEPVRTGSEPLPGGGRGPVVHVGASVGAVVVTGPTRPRSTGDLLHLADEAMYEAKRSGKGRYVVQPA